MTDLNQFLEAKDSLAAGTRSYVDSVKFDTNYEIPSSGIDTNRIRSITADKISAGTINSTVVYSGSIEASQIKAGTISVSLGLGGGNVTIDGANKRILVNDGTTDRILIGYGSGLF